MEIHATWADFWGVWRDIILPESGTLVLNLVLYGVGAFVVAIVLLWLGQKKGLFSRNRKYYNWAVKLYIPLILIGTVYFGLQWGLIRGIYKIAEHRCADLSTGVYALTVDQVLASPAEKEEFLAFCKVQLVTYAQSSEVFVDTLKARIMAQHTGAGFVDRAKDEVAAFLIDRYKDELFSAILFTALSQAAEKSGVPVEMSWSESAKMMDVLMKTDVAHLEASIKEKMTETVAKLFYSQYKSMRMSTWLMWLLIVVAFPLVEWAVYRLWLRDRIARPDRAEIRQVL